jgi:hypothetical protein
MLDRRPMSPKPYQLTWDDAVIILICWVVILWLILGGS